METPLIPKKLFNKIRKHFPPQGNHKRMKDLLFISAIIWVANNWSEWRQLPEFYGKWTTIYSRFRRWSRMGIFNKIFKHLSSELPKRYTAMIDSTYVKTHRTAASMRADGKDRSIGRSHGGLTTKIHLLCNADSKPMDFIITAGQVSDIKKAPQLIARNKMKKLIADKAYHSTKLRKELAKRNIEACIPVKSNSKVKIPHDMKLYEMRHKIENMFARIKDFIGLALRTARCSLCFESLVAVILITLFF